MEAWRPQPRGSPAAAATTGDGWVVVEMDFRAIGNSWSTTGSHHQYSQECYIPQGGPGESPAPGIYTKWERTGGFWVVEESRVRWGPWPYELWFEARSVGSEGRSKFLGGLSLVHRLCHLMTPPVRTSIPLLCKALKPHLSCNYFRLNI